MITFNRFYTNPFDKHIAKLEKVKNQLRSRRTTGETPMEVAPEEGAKADTAADHIEAAVAVLRELDRRRY
jgi:hypothetical protein